MFMFTPKPEFVLVGAGLGEAGVSTGLNRSDGIGPCELTQRARYHTLGEGRGGGGGGL
jgi:hypothetical protein